jgi:hypothetical protein
MERIRAFRQDWLFAASILWMISLCGFLIYVLFAA